MLFHITECNILTSVTPQKYKKHFNNINISTANLKYNQMDMLESNQLQLNKSNNMNVLQISEKTKKIIFRKNKIRQRKTHQRSI